MTTNAERALQYCSSRGAVRAKDFVSQGIPRVTLTRLVRDGRLERVGRGLYVVPGSDVSEHHGLVEASRRVPQGVVCLLSALRFHELTTQQPFEVWMAIDRKARKPRGGSLPIRIVRFGGNALTQGVDEHEIEGVMVRITSPARTVADCFKYRNKIGLDVAIEALRDYRRLRSGTLDQLWEAAGVAQIKTVIRPYMEAIA
ncbi:MAG: type IV toxin-antitoxin system AbiEi family antitoxin domain-containing protein [Thermoanaerobaculia bacterium]